jgi:hypothetical protein
MTGLLMAFFAINGQERMGFIARVKNIYFLGLPPPISYWAASRFAGLLLLFLPRQEKKSFRFFF